MSAANSLHLENPKVPNTSDCRRPAQDEDSDVLRQERAGNIRGHISYELRGNLNDERVRGALQAMLVADSVIHVGAVWLVRGG